MAEFEQLDVAPIEPVYWQASPNDSIDIGSVVLSIPNTDSGIAERATARVRLRFIPSECLELEVLGPTSHDDKVAAFFRVFNRRLGSNVRLDLPEYGTSLDGFATASSSQRTIYVPRQTPVQVYPTSQTIRRAVFHLFNWPELRGPDSFILRVGEKPPYGWTTCGRLRLHIDGWKITIAAREDTDGLVKALKTTGGYAITYVGSIEREDLADFSSDQLDELTAGLHYFFSFVFGRWTGPSLTTGFDLSRQRVYEQWGLSKISASSWDGSCSWFDRQHAELIGQVLPGFWKLRRNPIWFRPLCDALYWYCGANRPGLQEGVAIDAALLLTQAALELLSWNYCVQDKGILKKKDFKPGGLSAAEKLRRLATTLRIPIQIPLNLADLKSGKWADAMHAITELRNGLVHPGKVNNYSNGVYYDAWRLSLWFIELVLLALCQHNGKYANRLLMRHVGQLDDVPWSKP